MKFKYIPITISQIFIICIMSVAQLPWTKYEQNPVLSPGIPGAWDSDGIQVDAVVFDDGIYHMWYSTEIGVGYATSDDGLTWTKYEGNPVFVKGESGQWDEDFAGSVTVIKIDTLFHMWYGGSGTVFGSIGYATSPDGINWTRDPANPVLNAGEAGSWDRGAVQQPAVLFDGETYHMWYHGASANFSSFEIGYAVSADGINWTKDVNNPVIKKGKAGAWDNGSVISPFVIKTDSVFHLWYQSLFSADGAQFGYATSTDGSSWTKSPANPVYNEEGGVLSPTLIFDNQTFHMWYSYGDQLAVGYATAGLMLNVPTAYATIQAAIDSARDGDLVLVADGTYMENINFKGKAITVASHYYMDGDTSHINNTVIDGSNPSNPDSASVVSFVSDEDTSSILFGFTITGGSGTLFTTSDDISRGGGGIFCQYGATIVYNTIENNHINYNGSSSVGGGGIFAGTFFTTQDKRPVIIKKNIIRNNSVEHTGTQSAFGGGIFHHADGKITGNLISDNAATYSGPNSSVSGASFGGGISCFWQQNYITVEIHDNVISGNQSISSNNDWSTGGIGGGVDLIWTNSDFKGNIVSNNRVNENNIGYGAGMRFLKTQSTSKVRDNTFFNNGPITPVRFVNGAGLFVILAEGLTITNNLFYNNHGYYGGGLRLDDNQGTISLLNNTIVNNTATYGGGLWTRSTNTIIINSILWGNGASNSGDQIHRAGGILNVAYSAIEGSWDGEGNIDDDPLFTGENDYHLSDSSPAIGTGIDSVQISSKWYYAPFSDIDGNPRPNPESSMPDMGAYESPLDIAVYIEKEIVTSPLKFALDPNFPNPFNPVTTIRYQLPLNSEVDLSIYNLLGQKVAALVNQKQAAGIYQVDWDASDLSSGMYYYKIRAVSVNDKKAFSKVRKLILIK